MQTVALRLEQDWAWRVAKAAPAEGADEETNFKSQDNGHATRPPNPRHHVT